MTVRRRRPWFRRHLTVLAVGVLAMHGFATLVADRHYATTAHAVCADHGLAMDVPLSHADPSTPATVSERGADAGLLGHEHCAVAALASVQLDAPAPAVFWDGLVVEPGPPLCRRGDAVPHGGPSTLTLAPKSSPPA